MIDIDTLNPMQKEAVLHTEGPLLLLAGAGSGKTRVLTHRIAYLIEKGINPYNVLAITFTNKAAREMKERVESLVGTGNFIWISTFHSTCVRILRQDIERLSYDKNFTIYDASDSESIIKDILKQMQIDEKQFKPKMVMSKISDQKDKLITPQGMLENSQGDFLLGKIAQVYVAYQSRLKANNALDFDDLIFKTVELFAKNPDILERYQDRFQYILVDEYQDTNTSQYKLVKLLSAKYQNLCVVGDDDQSIYGWRGANIRNILDFEQDYKNAHVIKLEQNYRSTQTILNAANVVIKNNKGRKSKQLWTENNDGEKIKIYAAGSDLDEATFICEEIKKLADKNIKYSDIAILYRNNSLSRVIEEGLVRSSIPYRIYGGQNFYGRKEIKDVLAYLKVLYNPNDDVQLRRIINVPKRGIGDTTVIKLAEYANNHELSLFEALGNLSDIPELKSRKGKLLEFRNLIEELKELSLEVPINALIETLVEKTGYEKELKSEATDEALNRLENIQELMNKAIEFESEHEDTNLATFLEDVSLVADIDNFSETDDAVVLMTIHSAKGLEFPTVFIVAFEEGIFPGFRATVDPNPNAIEEERRLCYVAITRAKEQLYISFAKSRMQFKNFVYNAPSRFLKELDDEHLEFVNKKNAVNSIAANSKIKTQTGIDKKFPNSKTAPYTPSVFSYGGSIPSPKNIILDFEIGDKVRQMKYGVGTVTEIRPAGADYEISVDFPNLGIKKFMAHLSKLKKV